MARNGDEELGFELTRKPRGIQIDWKNPAKIGRLTFRPMPGKIVVVGIGDNERIGSGVLFAPQTLRVPRTTGRVIATYEPFLLDEEKGIESSPYVKVGDIVVFGQFSGTAIELEQGMVFILKEADILCMVDAEGDPEKELQHVEAQPHG